MGDLTEAEKGFAYVRSRVDSRGFTHVHALAAYDEALTLMRANSRDSSRIKSLLDGAMAGFVRHGMTGWTERAKFAATAAGDRLGG